MPMNTIKSYATFWIDIFGYAFFHLIRIAAEFLVNGLRKERKLIIHNLSTFVESNLVYC